MQKSQEIVVNQDIEGYLIPTAMPITVPTGTAVLLRQQLGTSATLEVNGNLVHVSSDNFPALGIKLKKAPLTKGVAFSEKLVWDTLKNCYDPEIPVNIVDLGLIYSCDVSTKNKQHTISIDMTLTAPGCGMGPVIVSDIKEKLNQLPNVVDTVVELVFDPPWSMDMMTDVAKLELGVI